MTQGKNFGNAWKIAAVVAAVCFLYWSIFAKLAADWWTDENYSHGLIIPFLIAWLIWSERDHIARTVTKPSTAAGSVIIAAGLVLLTAGILAAELFTQRTSFLLVAAGIIVFFAGTRILRPLLLPFLLILLSIPIPQIIFNKIAFPLQLFASKLAAWGIMMLDVPSLRSGNVIDILPRGATQTISLEVVEACSGIRSLVTLITIALVLGYFTRGRRRDPDAFAMMNGRDLLRSLILMVLAIPIAVLTNGGRVTLTGYLTYLYGSRATEGWFHDASGWLVYVVALAMLIVVNIVLKKLLSDRTQAND